MSVNYTGTLLVHLLSYISLKTKGTAMCWLCSSVAFAFITLRGTILFVNRKEAWRKRVLLWNSVRGEKKKSEQYLTVQIASELCNRSMAVAFCSLSTASGQKLNTSRKTLFSLKQSACFKASKTSFLRRWPHKSSTPSESSGHCKTSDGSDSQWLKQEKELCEMELQTGSWKGTTLQRTEMPYASSSTTFLAGMP